MVQSKLFSMFIIVCIIGSGCRKENVADAPIKTGSIFADAAYSIAVATGEEGGGMTETFSDMLNVQSLGNINPTMTITNGDFEIVRSNKAAYKPFTGWWTLNIIRTHSGRFTSFERRTYQYRFWKNSTRYQQHYVSNSDTAVMMEFKIVNGSGYFKNSTITHWLTKLSGAFLVTNLKNAVVTITLEDDYVRSSVDSIVTNKVLRVLTHSVTINKNNTNIKTLQFQPTMLKPIAHWRNDLHAEISGTMQGYISAVVTVSNEEYYKERTIGQGFAVILSSGSGEGSIRLGSNGTSGRFRFNLETATAD